MMANYFIMRKFHIFFLNCFLAVLFFQICSGVLDGEIKVVSGQISQEAILQLYVPKNISTQLVYVSHPSTKILYFVHSDNGLLTFSQPSESIYKNRTKDAYLSGNVFYFTLTDLRTDDAGIYKCDEKECQQMLIILGRPTKPVLLSDGIFVAYNNASFNCSSSSTSLPSNHGLHMNYIWKYNDHVLPYSEKVIYMMITKLYQGGNVTCQCYEDDKLMSETSNTVSLLVEYSPEKITIEPQDHITILEGKNLSIDCSVDCRPLCNLSWEKTDAGTPNFIKGKKLSLFHVRRFDAGIYTCTAENNHGTSSEEFTLDVHYEPFIHSYKICDRPVSNISMMENSYMNITLTVDSNPKPWVKMKKDGVWFNHQVIMKTTSEREKSVLQHPYKVTLSLMETACKDMGTYSVTVLNNYGQASQDFLVTLFCYPKLDKDRYFKKMFAPGLEDTVYVKMWLVSFPPPNIIQIYQNGDCLPLNHFLEEIKTGDEKYKTEIILTKKNFSINDIGDYAVELKNDITDHERSVNITFYFVDIGPPSVPLNLKVVDIESNAVELHWISAFNGGEKQTFSIYYRHIFGNWTRFNETYDDVGEGLIVSAKITGLRDFTSYLFKVVAKNVINESGYSEVRRAKTKGITSTRNDAPISSETGMYIGIGLCLVVLLLVVIVVVIMAKRRRKTKQKDKFFSSLKEGRCPMMSDANDNDSYSKTNHEYEEIRVTSKATTSAPPKPPRTYEEDEMIKVNEPIWKPAERKTPKVNENTEHLHDARRALKPVEKKPAF